MVSSANFRSLTEGSLLHYIIIMHLADLGMTVISPFMLENLPMWLNYNNSVKKSGPKFLHSDVKDSLPVITNT